MSPELDKLLCERYPKIFADRHKPMTETAMCWGFECGDGWYNIIDKLCFQIQSHIDWVNRDVKNSDSKVSQVVASQVKEKFGTLRFYYNGGDDFIRGLETMAESMSAVTCEQCGKPGKLRGRGWLYTACDEHTKPEHRNEEENNEESKI